MNNARTTIPATPTPPQDKNEAKAGDNKTATLSDLAQVTRLYELGLISKEQVQKIIVQVCTDNKKGADYLALIYCSAGCLVIYFILFVLSFNLYIQMMQLSK